MKHLSKMLKGLVAVFAAAAMALTLAPTAFAADGYTLTLKGTTEGHTYEAYQIFKGDLSDSTLSNIKWGTGIDSSKTSDLITALKADDTLKATFGEVTDAASVAEALSKAQYDDAVAKEFATVVSQHLSTTNTTKASSAGSTAINGLSAGYYLVKDKDKSLGTDKDKQDAYTRFILQVVGNTEAEIKSDVPTVEKKVKDTNDSTGTTSGWQDSADADINDDVQYQITGTMPNNIDDYTTYKYMFTDTMSKGLTYNKNAKIMIGDTDVTEHFTEHVGEKNADGGTTVTWTCDNLKAISGVTLDANTKVVVTYSAKLNDKAVIGAAGNPNTVNLTYSNNPNKGGEGETGKTPDDKNIVFTYKTVVNKVDQDNNALAGAEFTLSKVNADNTTTVVKTYTLTGNKDTDPTTFTASGLDDGTYVLKEIKTPAGYNTVADQYFTITADHETDSPDPKLTSLSGNKLSGSAQTTITFTADKDAGSLTTDVVNKKGSTLPSTGGMGTTVLYVAGAAIVVAAGIGLAIRRNKRQDA